MNASVTKVLKEAVAKAAALPAADQEKIALDLTRHIEKLQALRADLEQGVRSLDRGEGRELDIEELVRHARRRHGQA